MRVKKTKLKFKGEAGPRVSGYEGWDGPWALLSSRVG